jgi:membrane protein
MTDSASHRPDHRRREQSADRPDRRDGDSPGEDADRRLPDRPTADQGPPTPTRLSKRSWWKVLRRTANEFREDNLTDWAAALTYYGMLSLFPGMLVLISALRLTGPTITKRVIDTITGMAPGPTRDILRTAVGSLQHSQQSTAGILAIGGLAGALWSASAYLGAFMRASNAIYDVPEARPVWKTLPIRIGVTIVTGVMLAATALAVVFTGGLARQVGRLLHLGAGAVLVWDIAKWPVLAIMVSLLFAILYWATPNARLGGFRWVTPGGLLAVVVWLTASAGFAFYVARFGSYNKIYGSMTGVIVFLVWLWISNIAVLLGAEFDAELQRQRAVTVGHPPTDEPYLELRDTQRIDKERDADVG